MPYGSIEELPVPVRKPLPVRAQEVYKEAFNEAWSMYQRSIKRTKDQCREDIADRKAWEAVKKIYGQDNEGRWVRKA
jgi:cation transport regulator